MKRNLLLKTMFLLCALVVGSSSVWATEITYTFTSKTWTSANGNWTGTEGNANETKGVQCLKNTTYTVTSPSSLNNISKIVVTYGTAKDTGTSSTISIKIGDGSEISKNLAGGGLSGTTLQWDFSPAQTGAITMKIHASGASAYVKSVKVTYDEDTRIEVATIGDLGLTTLDYGAEGTFAPSITPADGLSASDYTVAWDEVANAQLTLLEDGEYAAGTTKGNVDVKVTVSPVSTKESTHKPISKIYTIKIVDPNAGQGTEAKPFSPSEAIDAYNAGELESTTEYYVQGLVDRIGSLSSGSLTYYISDDGSTTNELECYLGKNLGNTDFTSTSDIEVEDLVTVKGKINIYNNEVYMQSGNVITSYEPIRTIVNISTFEATESTLVKGETTTTSVTNNVPGWTASYSYVSNHTDIATVDATGKITAVAKGNASITVSPKISGEDPSYRVGETKSIDITIVNPSHTASFSVNGSIVKNESNEEEDAIVFPSDPENIGPKVFRGWKTSAIEGTTNDPQTLVNSATMGTEDVTFYAVFATVTPGNKETIIDELTRETTGVSGTTYTSWSNKKAANGSDAIYAGQSAGGNSSIQLRTDNSNSGIISTTSGGKVKKVVITWNSNTANNRKLDVYGKNTAYTAVTQLYTTAQGTSLGSIVKGTSTSVDIEGDYEYVGLRSNSGAMYISKIEITWETGTPDTYSEFCTTIPPTSATITTAEYATFSSPYATDFSSTGITVYTAADNETSVTLNEITTGKVPANTPVVLYKAGADGTAINVPVIASADAVGSNDLHVVGEGGLTGEDNIFVLSKKNSVVGFYLWDKTKTLNAGKIYLQGSGSSARNFLGFESTTTSINALDNLTKSQFDNNAPMYNLAGQRVSKNYKGIVIVNGKKMLNK